ncbi:hypothetical protein OSB04_001339 [Centaurea solstitialis]|uniref:Uncharacterized protein n=1 Tax=Centaurea solstitialis TaxID=347529 RepID=A0AA38U9V9_9ASTR|nr:hypothetical protein OSB04_001339 [Centaurea solstitialis]
MTKFDISVSSEHGTRSILPYSRQVLIECNWSRVKPFTLQTLLSLAITSNQPLQHNNAFLHSSFFLNKRFQLISILILNLISIDEFVNPMDDLVVDDEACNNQGFKKRTYSNLIVDW